MQMIYDAALLAEQSKALRKAFEEERRAHAAEDAALSEADRAQRLSDECRARAERVAEESDRQRFAERKAVV